MKKENITKIISLIINLFIFVCTLILVILQTQIELRSVSDPSKMMLFKYFTTLSNMYSGLISLVIVIYMLINIKKIEAFPKWLSYLHLSAVSSVALTFLTCVFFLAPMEVMEHRSYWNMFSDFSFFVHFFNPVLAIIDFIFLHKYINMNWKDAFWGIIPMVIYGAFYSIFVINDVWKDFYGFTFGGNKGLVFLVLPIMVSVTYLISFLLVMSKRIGKK